MYKHTKTSTETSEHSVRHTGTVRDRDKNTHKYKELDKQTKKKTHRQDKRTGSHSGTVKLRQNTNNQLLPGLLQSTYSCPGYPSCPPKNPIAILNPNFSYTLVGYTAG